MKLLHITIAVVYIFIPWIGAFFSILMYGPIAFSTTGIVVLVLYPLIVGLGLLLAYHAGRLSKNL